MGRLVQWGGQVECQALQVAADLQCRLALLDRQLHLVGRTAAGVLCQMGQQSQFAGLAQSSSAGHALGAQLDRGIAGAHTTFQAHAATQGLCLHACQAKAFFTELHAATHLGEQGRIGLQAYFVVACEGDAALHLAALQRGNRQGEL